MMIEEIKNIKSGRKELRKFGVSVGMIFALLAGLLFWREKESYSVFLILAALLVVPGLILPAVLKPIYRVWMTLAVIMGWLMTRVILSLLFYLLVTPIAFSARIFGKDFLDRAFERDGRESYWIKKEPMKTEKKDYERQF